MINQTNEEQREENIICGFAGIGKSTLAKQGGYVDLESTPFNKNWKLYADVATHMANNGYKVMLSCHKEIRDELKLRKTNYIVAIPNINKKSEYIERYKKRGNTEDFITLLEANFEDWLGKIIKEENNILVVDRYLSDIFQPCPKPNHNKKGDSNEER